MDLPEGWQPPHRQDGDGPWVCSRVGCGEPAVLQVALPAGDAGDTVPVMACGGHTAELEELAAAP